MSKSKSKTQIPGRKKIVPPRAPPQPPQPKVPPTPMGPIKQGSQIRCRFCGKVFRLKPDLDEHIKEQHKK